MAKKYVATLLRKYNLGNDYFLFTAVHNIFGNYQEDTDCFIDEEENDYFSYRCPYLMFSEEEYAFGNPISLSELKEEHKGLSLKEALMCYQEENCLKATFVTTDDLDQEKVICKNIFLPDIFEKEWFLPFECSKLIEEIDQGKYRKEELTFLKELLSKDNMLTIEKEKAQKEVVQKNNSIFFQNSNANAMQKEKETNMILLKKKLKETVIAQDDAIDRLVTEISRMEHGKKKSGILLTGSTGVGKTKIMEMIAENIDRPFKVIDSTQITSPGYVGKDIEEVLYELYVDCGKDLEKTEHAILYFDEIDKKGTANKMDVAGRAVLNLLLKFLDGTTYNATQSKNSSTSVSIKTNNMLILAGGAFMDVYQALEQKKEPVGFQKDSYIKKTTPQLEDFTTIAMMPEEFMGRFPIIVHLNSLSKENLKQILIQGKESPIQNEKKVFLTLGVELLLEDSYYEKAAEVAFERKTGARALEGVISESTWRAYQEVAEHPLYYDQLVLTGDTIVNNQNYTLTKKEEKQLPVVRKEPKLLYKTKKI